MGIYAGYVSYVIKEKKTGRYVGPDSDRFRVAMKEHAARFTKEDAIEYVKSGLFCAGNDEFYIEEF